MKKILFLIHDLGHGGAEKVLVNLVNHMDQSQFDITVMSLFGGGVNEQNLNSDIRYITAFSRTVPGNSKLMKLFSPKQLHSFFIKDHYDIEISYLEGPCARIISGCSDSKTKLVSWIHTKFNRKEEIISPFRNKKEALSCYQRFDYTAFVSKDVGENFCRMISLTNSNEVLYNTIESDKVLSLSKEEASISVDYTITNIITVGTLKEVKGYDRLLRIAKRLVEENYHIHLYIVGSGPLEQDFKNYIQENELDNYVTLLGFDINPYKYVSKCDLYVCSSHTEGFSTAATEALIAGTPVCTVEVSGMREMLGENNEYGLVTGNDEESLYEGIKSLIDNPELLSHYKKKAIERSQIFSTEKTVQAVENMLLLI